MNNVWRSPLVLGCIVLLFACEPNHSQGKGRAIAQEEAGKNCPQTDITASRFDPKKQVPADQLFDYATRNIQSTTDTITFQTPNHDLVYCRSTKSWAVLPPSLESSPPKDNEPLDIDPLDELSDPPFQAIAANNQNYKYRVNLQPNPFTDSAELPEKVTFTIQSDQTATPQTIDLYDLKQLRAAGIGYDLGFPIVNSVIPFGDYLFFAISAEQGEGFNGITTLLRYNLKNNKIEPIQPQNLIGEQITQMIATEADGTITLWLGTKYSHEGSSRVPAKGLVTYSFTEDTWTAGKITAYSVHNSPLIGAIPQQLFLEAQTMWVATGGGICTFPWQQVQQWETWQCWRFALETELDTAGVPLYKSLLSTMPITTLTPFPNGAKTEVYWWSSLVPVEDSGQGSPSGRFEVAYPGGLGLALPEGGYYWKNAQSIAPPPPWEDHVFWAGEAWHWQGDGFLRDFDEVDFNYFALGATGISQRGYTNGGLQDVNAMRGRLALVSLTTDKTELMYFSGWVDDGLIEPHFVLLSADKQPTTTPNPLKAIAPSLESF